MSTKIAINGAGRIGRAFIRMAEERDDIEVVAINDLGDHANIAYLLNYDTVHGRSNFHAEIEQETGDDSGNLLLDGRRVEFLSEKDPAALPWAELQVDVVVEATGAFTEYAKAKMHLDAGAKRVVITAPAKGDPVPGVESGTVLIGVNEEKFATCQITSNGSCTTNAGAAITKVLDEALGIERALLNTVHAYTATQSIVDGPVRGGSDFRKGRAAAQNIIPSSTGAAIATTQVLPQLENKYDGIALRVPVPSGSVADITFIAGRDTSAEEVNEILTKAANLEEYKEIFMVTNEQVVSSDIVGQPYAGIVDLGMTRVVGNLVKVLSWYDNEVGYTSTLVKHVAKLGQYL